MFKSKSAILALLLGLLLTIAWLYNHNSLGLLFEYKRSQVTGGDWWRLYTCNFVHYTFYHLMMNAIGIVVIGVLFWPQAQVKLLLIALVIIPSCIGGGMFILGDNLSTYRGFSGVLYGVLCMAFLLNFKLDRLVFGVALIGLAGKIIFEQSPWFDNDYMQEQLGSSVSVESHLFGVLAGVGICSIVWLWKFGRMYYFQRPLTDSGNRQQASSNKD